MSGCGAGYTRIQEFRRGLEVYASHSGPGFVNEKFVSRLLLRLREF